LLKVLEVMPFHYLAYFPDGLYGKKQGTDLIVRPLPDRSSGAIGLILLSRGCTSSGLRRYSAFGDDRIAAMRA